MRLIIKRLRYKNFLSTGNQWTEIDFLSVKKTLIVGKNGSGKSTLLDALSFVLFNKPFRKINKPQLVNTIVNKDCVVEIEFGLTGHEWKVIRGIKPNIFEIYKDGVLCNQSPDVRDYQQAFEQHIIRCNHKTFCQVVVLGSAIFTPFMSLGSLQRREIIEDLLDLEIFSKMNDLLKKQMTDLDKNLIKVEGDKRVAEERLKLIAEHSDKNVEEQKRQLKQFKVSLEEIDATLKSIDEQIVQYNQQIEVVDRKVLQTAAPAQANRHRLIEVQADLRSQFVRLHQELLLYMQNDNCPTCHQEITQEFKTKIVKEREETIKTVEEAQIVLEQKLKVVDAKLKESEEIKKNKTSVRKSSIWS